MDATEAKRRITEIFNAVNQHDPRYWYEDTWIRWGFIQRDLCVIIDELVVAEEKR